MAKNFQKEAFDRMKKPVIIVVSSCKVTEYANNLQLSSSPATFYYLNPDIPELEQLIADMMIQRKKKPERLPLSTLLQENPDSYKGVRFTTEGTIIRINTSRNWYYVSCNKCIKKVRDRNDIPGCLINKQTKQDGQGVLKSEVSFQTAFALTKYARKMATNVCRADGLANRLEYKWIHAKDMSGWMGFWLPILFGLFCQFKKYTGIKIKVDVFEACSVSPIGRIMLELDEIMQFVNVFLLLCGQTSFLDKGKQKEIAPTLM
nr:replication protein A 70 kDa DNA-binding subunit [Tanacetum cinerariifolium]